MRRQVLTAELEKLGLEIDAKHNNVDKSGQFRATPQQANVSVIVIEQQQEQILEIIEAPVVTAPIDVVVQQESIIEEIKLIVPEVKENIKVTSTHEKEKPKKKKP